MHPSKIGLKSKPKANIQRPGIHSAYFYYVDGEIQCMLMPKLGEKVIHSFSEEITADHTAPAGGLHSVRATEGGLVKKSFCISRQ